MELTYYSGFGNEFESQVNKPQLGLVNNLPPPGQLNPQKCPNALFCEQLSGTAFTVPRSQQRRSWLYRVHPTCKNVSIANSNRPVFDDLLIDDPNPRRWLPFGEHEMDKEKYQNYDFFDSLSSSLIASGGKELVTSRLGSVNIYIYVFGLDQTPNNRCIQNSDGDFLIVPQQCALLVTTEFGQMIVNPKEICVIQAGMKFSIDIYKQNNQSESQIFARGYVLEIVGSHFELPNLGPIGANGLANPRDFLTPVARVDHDCRNSSSWKLFNKFNGKFFVHGLQYTPYDVAAWIGNYVPFKYDLNKFVALNTVTVDHPDPSIFTVLTAPSLKPGTALADFVIFPPRWEVANQTFRPPYYHRNCMTEFMGLIEGQYQAKSATFSPGGATLHPAMTGHGPDKQCYDVAVSQDTSQPRRVADNSLAFMFETSISLKLTQFACSDCSCVDKEYHKCWADL